MTISFEEFTLRLTELETRAAHYERMAEEMSDVLTKQSVLIERMNLQLRQLKEQKDSATDWAPSPQDAKPPPHY